MTAENSESPSSGQALSGTLLGSLQHSFKPLGGAKSLTHLSVFGLDFRPFGPQAIESQSPTWKILATPASSSSSFYLRNTEQYLCMKIKYYNTHRAEKHNFTLMTTL